ncbi:MAG TPA: hypothetical protein VFA53_12825 [Xanthobacteraceae bacterium]|nr:hypothetical protein [Xanthobacteraceae bacterium]
MKAIVLTCDRYRAMTDHMILQYERLWPDHPFRFRIPFQDLGGENSDRREYVKSPAPIAATALALISDLDDEEWIYWCIDDKYPVQIVVDKAKSFLADLDRAPDMSGLLFCRCRELLTYAERNVNPLPRLNSFRDAYLERKSWAQIWLHQFLRVKVIRHFFSHVPADLRAAKDLDEIKRGIPKPRELRLFVTEDNFAVFGESTSRGEITQNCYDSIRQTNIALPPWFARSNGEVLLMGKL